MSTKRKSTKHIWMVEAAYKESRWMPFIGTCRLTKKEALSAFHDSEAGGSYYRVRVSKFAASSRGERADG